MSQIQIVRKDVYAEDRALRITVRDRDTGQPVDLTDTTVRFMVKADPSDADEDALISKSTTAGIALADPQTGDTEGLAYVTLTADDTDIPPGWYEFEIEATDAIGDITLAHGGFGVVGDMIG